MTGGTRYAVSRGYLNVTHCHLYQLYTPRKVESGKWKLEIRNWKSLLVETVCT